MMSGRILVVDDDVPFCCSLQAILHGAGYMVEAAHSASEALRLRSQQPVDLVLLDLGLPDLAGLDLAEFLTGNCDDCEVIILTGQANVSSAIHAIELGCFDYLCKPCAPERLLVSVRQALNARNLKAELNFCHHRFTSLTETTGEAVAVCSRHGINQVNSRFLEIFKVTSEEVQQFELSHFLPELLNVFDDSAYGAEPFSVTREMDAFSQDGLVFPVTVRISPLLDQEEQSWLAVIKDQREQRDRTHQQQLLQERLTNALRLESLGIMAGTVAHDLNNILSGLVTLPEMVLARMPEGSRYKKDLSRIQQAGRLAADVVSDLLTVARGSSVSKEIRDLNQLLQQYRESLEFEELAKAFPEVKVCWQLGRDIEQTSLSPLHIGKTLSNLVRNACEAIATSGVLKIATEMQDLQQTLQGYDAVPPGRYVVLTVSDDGPGIPAGHLSRLFEPFYSKKRLDQSGTGLGLTVVLQTMRDHGGFIDLTSQPGATSFVLFFPVQTEQGSCLFPTEPGDNLLGRGERILVVDDEVEQLRITSAILKRLGYTPVTARTGEEAIRKVMQEPVDLLLLDLVMDPGMSGYETYRHILQLIPDQKAMVTSGHHNHTDMERIRKLGATACLTKPLSVSKLALSLKEELRS